MKFLLYCVLLYGVHGLCDWSFHAKDGYFRQYYDKNSVTTEMENWGLNKDYTWDSLMAHLRDKTESSNGKHLFKLVFFARHGEAWHNVIKEEVGENDWGDVCQYDTYDGVTLFDDDLTECGVCEVESLAVEWQHQVYYNGMPTPDSFYVSPLQRALHTFQLTWGQSTAGTVVESLRERSGECTCYERHPRSWIAKRHPQLAFEAGFSEEDELWTAARESKEDVRRRCRGFLQGLAEHDGSSVVSVTSHAGTLRQLLALLGHREHSLRPGEVLPVVLEAVLR